jgi:SAM-dependent methyltransferase
MCHDLAIRKPGQGDDMTDATNFYQQQYGAMMAPVYRDIRAATYDEDMGQTGWLTVAELKSFLGSMKVPTDGRVLEVACGSGGACLVTSLETGAQVVGVDHSEPAVAAATARAAAEPGGGQVQFQVADATRPLEFPDRSFDAIFCNDAINHLGKRQAVLAGWLRLLRPGGRLLYTDPVVVRGAVTADEFAARSTIGDFIFMPQGENEALLKAAGFTSVGGWDVSENIIQISGRWRDAREARREELVALESEAGFLAAQSLLDAVHLLSAEGRLARQAFLGVRPQASA